jgi:uncharacterized membrane protein YfcA|tara:strand:+ start:1266 stop:2054 length:789 start_codon:yes stop_codon:yes gene_type:complete
MIEELILFASLGIFAGLIAGLFGIGGGIITVPVLVACFIGYGFDEKIIIHLAVGTSLACIFFTGLSSANAHKKKGAIDFLLFRQVGFGIILGAFLGAIFAIQLNGNLLKNIIGTFILLVAIQISFNLNLSVRKNNVSREPYIIGTGIGFLSSILGIGGGIFSVPYFKYLGLNMTSSVGTSAACGIPIAFFGALVYFILGASNDNLPSLTFGYIYLPALFGITITSIFSAKFGADIAHYVSEITLKKLMVSLMLLISIYMFVI